jgi:hypothetical protein
MTAIALVVKFATRLVVRTQFQHLSQTVPKPTN